MPFLREMVDYCIFEADINHHELSPDHFRSVQTCLIPPQCLSTFWLRSVVRSRSMSGQCHRLTLLQLHVLFMSTGVSGGPEFVSSFHLRHRRLISTAVQAAASSQVASGRPAVTDAARRT